MGWDEAHVPMLLCAVYGDYPVKLVILLRDPVKRLEASFWWTPFFSFFFDHHFAARLVKRQWQRLPFAICGASPLERDATFEQLGH